jgi:hypothetical protein
MRRACVAWCVKHRSDSVARSTPTAKRSKQERPIFKNYWSSGRRGTIIGFEP